MSGSDYSTRRGVHNGEQGTFYDVHERGGPGKHPYTITYFVPDRVTKPPWLRGAPANRPWEQPGAVRIK